MDTAVIKTIMHIAPRIGGFGIRIRLTRHTTGIWMGEGWGGPANAKMAHECGAQTTLEGWMWPTAEEAEAHMNTIVNDAVSFGYEDVK